ncbi:adenosine deaminase [Pigmentiphaga sp. NML080357]|mgnify:CR=1 FL=1|uniref:adenosine deaminase n=1 Tax=Pigmentiphaga sp. NML080357 TaxID=2008675 RepID=UPI000B411CD8|nr:adenosine deaminase [Pigmentiphaga sp. NML080357]OVZ60811.1 adenosine deaminase [Pigmentiphaga sp. NML080357]
MALDAARYVAGLPKAELHMHIEGSIEPELMFELAARNGVPLRWKTVEEVRQAYRFHNLQSFLDLYYDGCRVLVTERDFHDVTRAYLRRAHADRVRHAEMFIGPQGHTRRGVALETVLEGVLAAMDAAEREDGITSGLLLGAQRHLPEEDALAMLEAAEPWRDRILGYGLGGAEVGNPPSKFARFFAACRERGFRVTAHAGEEGPASYVRESVELLQVDRIDHGNSCLDDPALVAELAARGTPLTVCPLSNLRLRVVEDMTRHPLATMLRAGLNATVNSDDPSYFGGYVNDNYLACHEALGLDIDDLTLLARNSIRASFLPAERQAALLADIDAWRAAAEAP